MIKTYYKSNREKTGSDSNEARWVSLESDPNFFIRQDVHPALTLDTDLSQHLHVHVILCLV